MARQKDLEKFIENMKKTDEQMVKQTNGKYQPQTNISKQILNGTYTNPLESILEQQRALTQQRHEQEQKKAQQRYSDFQNLQQQRKIERAQQEAENRQKAQERYSQFNQLKNQRAEEKNQKLEEEQKQKQKVEEKKQAQAQEIEEKREELTKKALETTGKTSLNEKESQMIENILKEQYGNTISTINYKEKTASVKSDRNIVTDLSKNIKEIDSEHKGITYNPLEDFAEDYSEFAQNKTVSTATKILNPTSILGNIGTKLWSEALDRAVGTKNINDDIDNIAGVAKDMPKTVENLKYGGINSVINFAQTAVDYPDRLERKYENMSPGEFVVRSILDAPATLSEIGGSKLVNGITDALDKEGKIKNEFYEYTNEIKNKNLEKIQENIDKSSNDLSAKLQSLAPSLANNAIGAGVSSINPVAGMLYFTGSATGSYKDEALSMGMTEEEADRYSDFMGKMEGATDTFLSVEMIQNVTGKEITSSAIKEVSQEGIENFVSKYGIELGEEFIQEAVIPFVDEAAKFAISGDKHLKYDYTTKEGWINLLNDAYEDGKDGALSAIIMMGATKGVDSCVKLLNSQSITDNEIKAAINDCKNANINVSQIAEIAIESSFKNNFQELLNKASENNQEQDKLIIHDELLKNIELQKQEQSIKEQPINDQRNQEIQKNIEQELLREQKQKQVSEQVNTSQKQVSEQVNTSEEAYKYEPSDNEQINILRKSANKYLDNSEETQNIVKLSEKLIEDKGYNIKFDDTITNEKGKTVNARIIKNNGETTIEINPKSNKAMEFLLGHELTHEIGRDSLIKMINNYAENKYGNEFIGAVQQLKELYGTQEINEEVAADICGQLLGNQEFINTLSTKNPSFFRKILNAIESLVNKLTGNKIESLFLKDLQNKYREAYRKSNTNSNSNTDVKYSLQDSNIQNQINRETILERDGRDTSQPSEKLNNYSSFSNEEINSKINNNDKMNMLSDDGIIMSYVRITNQNTQNYGTTYGQNLEPSGEYMLMDILRGKSRVPGAEYGTIQFKNPLILDHINTTETGWKKTLSEMFDNKTGETLTKALKEAGYDGIITIDEDGNYSEIVNINGIKNESIESNNDSFFVPQKDNKGRTLTSEQQEYFKDSKARNDEKTNGELTTVYHTTTQATAQFNTFNPVGTPHYRFGNQIVNYYTNLQDMSSSYADQHYSKAITGKSIDSLKEYLSSNNDKYYSYELKKNNDGSFIVEKKANTQKDSFFNKLDKELNTLKNTDFETYNKLKDEAWILDNPYYLFDVNDKISDFIYKVNEFSDEYTGGETARVIQNYIKYKAGDSNNIFFMNEDDLMNNFFNKVQNNHFIRQNNLQYEGYVNIKNPYIIDAEGRNWNKVSIERNQQAINEINEISQDNKDKMIKIYEEVDNISNNIMDNFSFIKTLVYELSEGEVNNLNSYIDYLVFKEDGDYDRANSVIDLVTETRGISRDEFISNIYNKPLNNSQKNVLRFYGSRFKDFNSINTLKDFYDQSGYYEKRKAMVNHNAKELFDKKIKDIKPKNISKKISDNLYNLARNDFSPEYYLEQLSNNKTTNDIVMDILEKNNELLNNELNWKDNNITQEEILKAGGYDGIIIKNVYDYGGEPFEEMKPANLYITFESNQFKAADNLTPTNNQDIRYSLESNSESEWERFLEKNFKNKGTKTYFKDILQNQQQTIQEEVKKEISNIVEPMQETMQKLSENIEKITKNAENEAEKIENKSFEDVVSEAMENFTPENIKEEIKLPALEDKRDINEVGNRNIKAYQYENPEVKPFFQEEAKNMLYDLESSTKGERQKIDGEWTGTIRSTTKAIAELLDDFGYSYEQIKKGLKAIIEDNGAENNAVSKRIEFKLDEQLREGYTDNEGYKIPPNQKYIDFIQGKDITNYNEEAYNNIQEDINTQENDFDNFETDIEEDDGKTFEDLLKEQGLLDDAPLTEKERQDLYNMFDDLNNLYEDAQFSLQNEETESKFSNEPVTTNETAEKILKNEGDTILDTKEFINNKRTKQKTSLTELKNNFIQAIVNKGHYIDKLSKKVKNAELKWKYDRYLGSSGEGQYVIERAQTNNEGNRIGKSIKEIFKPAEKANLYIEFNDYLFNQQNIDRLVVDKALYKKQFTAENSKRIINEYEKKYPQFKDWAKDVYSYNKNRLKNIQKAGFISEETYSNLLDMYGHYVPTYRDIVDGIETRFNEDNNKVGYSPLQRATGGTQQLLAIDEAMAEQVMSEKRALRLNETMKELQNALKAETKIDTEKATKKDINLQKTLDYVVAHENYEAESSPVNIDNPLTAFQQDLANPENFTMKDGGKYYGMYYENGEIYQFEISKGIYDAFQRSKIEETIENNAFLKKTLGAVAKINRAERKILTELNPEFLARNAFKDIQDGVFNSKFSAARFAKNYAYATEQILTNGDYYDMYLANGGETNTYFDYDTGIQKDGKLKKVLKAPATAIETLNNKIEIIPRLAEFISTLETGGTIEEAMYNAAEVTTNFKRGGDITKALNKYGVNFLNASVQGLDKNIRLLKGENGVKGYFRLITKATALGIAATAINGALYGDDEDYQDLPDYIKNGYWLFKTSDGKFFRIPQGRVSSVITTVAREIQDTVNGERDITKAVKNVASNAVEQLAPNNPIENNIISPILQVKNNKSWYGEDIVGSRLSKLPEAEQVDERTDEFSKFLGQQLNISPKKINYLLEQYTGGIGKTITSSLTPYAEENVIERNFVTDPVLKNKNVGEFYDLLEDMQKQKNGSNATDEDNLMYSYLSKQSSKMSEYYTQQHKIQNSDLSDEEKKEQSREIKKKINNLAEEALEQYQNINKRSNYAQIGDVEYYKDKNGEWKTNNETKQDKIDNLNLTSTQKNTYYATSNKISTIATTETNSETKKTKIANAILSTNLNDKAKAQLYKNQYSSDSKIDIAAQTKIIDSYLKLQSQNLKADKDKNGKTISGSLKNKTISYVNSLNISAGQKALLIKMKGYNDYNKQAIQYINTLNLTTKEKNQIYTDLGFKVDGNKISW